MALLNDVMYLLNSYRSSVIHHDIRPAIRSKSRYLAALGLSTYTEVFGGLYRGRLDQGNSENNYMTFIRKFFPPAYCEVNLRLCDDNLNGLYGAVRCSLVHEYLIKDRLIIKMACPKPLTCGIVYEPNEDPQITFVVEQYFADFMKAMAAYFDSIRKKSHIVTKFQKALASINSPLVKSPRIP